MWPLSYYCQQLKHHIQANPQSLVSSTPLKAPTPIKIEASPTTPPAVLAAPSQPAIPRLAFAVLHAPSPPATPRLAFAVLHAPSPPATPRLAFAVLHAPSPPATPHPAFAEVYVPSGQVRPASTVASGNPRVYNDRVINGRITKPVNRGPSGSSGQWFQWPWWPLLPPRLYALGLEEPQPPDSFNTSSSGFSVSTASSFLLVLS